MKTFLSSAIIAALTLTSCTAKYTKEEQILGQRIDDLESQLSEEKAKEAGLQRKIEGLGEQIAEKEAKIAELQKRLENLDQQYGSEKTKNSDLVRQINAEKMNEQRLQKQVDLFNAQLERIKAETEKELKRNEETYNRLLSSLKDEIQKDEVTINKYKNALTINIAERILFDLGRAEIKPQYYPILNKVGKIIQGLTDKFIQVEGHTDDVPIAAEYQWKIPNNWALGARRAINVTTYFIDHFKIDPQRIAVMSFSKYRPLVPNTSAANRAKNRRIEIVILDKSLYQEMERKHGL